MITKIQAMCMQTAISYNHDVNCLQPSTVLPAQVGWSPLALGLPRSWLKSSNTLLSREENAVKVKSCINPLRDLCTFMQLLSDAVTNN